MSIYRTLNRGTSSFSNRSLELIRLSTQSQKEIEKDESLNFLLRDTISLTMMGGSEQTNVIPPEAWANLDVRLLPGGDPKAVLEAIRRVLDEPSQAGTVIKTRSRSLASANAVAAG